LTLIMKLVTRQHRDIFQPNIIDETRNIFLKRKQGQAILFRR